MTDLVDDEGEDRTMVAGADQCSRIVHESA
jgi:hypothetical protein